MQMKEVAEGIHEIDAETRVPISCSCYLIEAEKPALVETGPALQVPALKEALGARKLAYIIVTHAHVDHAGGLGELLAASPGTMAVMHEDAARHLVDPRRLMAGIKQVFGDDFEQIYGRFLPVREERILTVRGGTVLSLGDRELRVIDTPGHVSHHVSLFDPLTQGLFAGDALGSGVPNGVFTGICAAPPGYDMEATLKSIAELKRLAPRLVFIAHNGTWGDDQALFDLADKNTRGCAEIVLRSAKAGEDLAAIRQKLLDYVGDESDFSRFAIDTLAVPGFLHYFRKRELL